jgi:hypothetical protein
MTEQEWMECTDQTPMLEFLKDKTTERKFRLLAVGCCYRVWQWMTDDRSRQAIDISEKYADSLVGQKKLNAARREAYTATRSPNPPPTPTPNQSPHTDLAATMALHASSNSKMVEPWMIACSTAGNGVSLSFCFIGSDAGWNEKREQCHLIRCVFGNPFRPVTINPAWLTWNDGTVRRIAQAIYDERAFDRMPILADALEDAGCDNADILNHCRRNSPHVRGCWLVDLLLGKE